MTNKVKMLKTVLGCDASVIHPTEYIEGQTYTIGGSLLDAFIDMGACELVVETKVVAPKETKKKPVAKKKAK